MTLFTNNKTALLQNKTGEEANQQMNAPIVNNESGSKNAETEKKDNIITITWGTGMPIDIIFNFIHKNFEEDGYQDALVNTDLKYRETKEEIIRNDLKMLFRRIVLRYKKDIRMLDVQMENAQKAYALSSASMLQAQRETFEEHLSEIEGMEKMLEENDPKMTTMIESYRRGFFKGIAAQAEKFINNI